MLESSRTELKNCLFDLRSDTVDDPDFARAIRKTLAGLESEADVSIRFRVARAQMTDTTAHAILCIIRELAANAVPDASNRANAQTLVLKTFIVFPLLAFVQ